MVKLEVAQYSVFCKPQDYYRDFQEIRTSEIPSALVNQISKDLDIICFNQAYDYKSRNILVEQGSKLGFSFYTKLIGEDQDEFTYNCCSTKLKTTNGGVFLISKYKILKTEILELDQKPIEGSKINAIKGVLYAKIKKQEKIFNIFSGDFKTKSEITNLISFMESQQIKNDEVVLIIGEFGIDMFKSVKSFKKLTKKLNAITPVKVPESLDSTLASYNSLVKNKKESFWHNYVLVGVNYSVPSAAKMSSVRITPEIPICLRKSSCFRKSKLAVDLSDHFPIFFQGFWV